MKIGLFLGSFAGGGAERMMINLANGLAKKGVNVFIFVGNNSGPYKKIISTNVEIIDLKAKAGIKSLIFKFRKILKSNNVDIIISTQMHVNAFLCISTLGIKKRPKIILREANTASKMRMSKFVEIFYSISYKLADYYIAVSEGVKIDMKKFYPISKDKIKVIYNPVVDEELLAKKEEVVSDSWYKEYDIIIGMGRVLPQKRFDDLIKAFYKVNKSLPNTRLIIYGNKELERKHLIYLNKLITDLDIGDKVKFPGFVDNPFKYLSNASLFVSSSEFEGLPGVLIQAMACGCSVVSTDCPSGPAEILKEGKLGTLVDVGDVNQLAIAMHNTLVNKDNEKGLLINRAQDFSLENSVEQYYKILSKMLNS